MLELNLKIILATIIILMAVIDDVLTQKIHNKLILLFLILTLFTLYSIGGTEQITAGFLALTVTITILLPCYLLGIIGGGDLKLISILALLFTWNQIIEIIIFSFVWGGVLGFIKIILSGKLKLLFNNYLNLIIFKNPSSLKLSTIPFSIAIFLGYLSYLFLNMKGVSLL